MVKIVMIVEIDSEAYMCILHSIELGNSLRVVSLVL